MPYFQLDGVGAAFTATHTAAQFKKGTKFNGNDNTVVLYVQNGSAAMSAGMVGAVDTALTLHPVTTALAVEGAPIGVVQNAFPSANYGFVFLEGVNLDVRLGATAGVTDVQLCIGATAGELVAQNTAASLTVLEGIRATDVPTAAGGNGKANLSCTIHLA